MAQQSHFGRCSPCYTTGGQVLRFRERVTAGECKLELNGDLRLPAWGSASPDGWGLLFPDLPSARHQPALFKGEHKWGGVVAGWLAGTAAAAAAGC